MSEAKRYSTYGRPFLELVGGGISGHAVLRIRQATDQGYIECDPQGVFDADYPQSELRRARVKDRGQCCGTLMSGPPAFCVFIEYNL